ncbi:MAG: hypothetical protein GX488_02050 [Clostridiales bacterium]|nr:hypothetical protein [Clostridiales bacterium]
MKKAVQEKKKKAYPILPYLISLFVIVVALVLLSYLMQLRNRQELVQFSENQSASEFVLDEDEM